jgi:hypothetical protein
MPCSNDTAMPTLRLRDSARFAPDLMPRSLIVASCLLVAGLLVTTASAQNFSFNADRPIAVQAVSFGYYLIDFDYDGESDPPFRFDFNNPAYGITYSRPSFLVTLGYGQQDADNAGSEALSLLDLTLTTWGDFVLSASDRARLFVPVVLYSNYRRVSPQEDSASLDAFNVTVLGLGAGLGASQQLGERVLLEARAHPIFGLASSSFVDGVGSARVLDADVQLHLAQLFGKVGLSFGYTFKSQTWDVNASNLFPDLTDDLFDYRGTQHLFRAGINW